jgi:hypothetical protein
VEAMKGENEHPEFALEQYHSKNRHLEDELREYKQKVQSKTLIYV